VAGFEINNKEISSSTWHANGQLISFSLMNYVKLFLLTFLLASFGCKDEIDADELKTVFENTGGLETATYAEGIDWWTKLEDASPFVRMETFGETDAGLPLHLIIINGKRNFSRENILESSQLICLVNNGIHPGEPDGIDASMLFARDLVSDPDFEEKHKDVVVLIIPFYNVGGALNRSCCSRANQNGPESYGFRGNARNLDLNRDFIKCDSKNAKSFNELFSSWDPDIYLETHVTNGADYPYTMTFLTSQADKLGFGLGEYVRNDLSDYMYKAMQDEGDEMIPYVNLFGDSPDAGYTCFYDSPRYSTGYAALHLSIGLLTETHMLKPFKQRVESTHRFMHHLMNHLTESSQKIQALRKAAHTEILNLGEFAIDWELDSSRSTSLPFKGYEAYYDTSNVTQKPQLFYNQNKTWEKEIPFLNFMKPSNIIKAPHYYLMPTAWNDVVELLRLNRVEMKLIERDTTLDVVAYEMLDFQTAKSPYEGHYLHNNCKTEKQYWNKTLQAGSYYLIDLNQKKKRFIFETLEPEAPDSYFNWNYFDEILQQKEWFSSYVFDAKAEEMLKDPKIKKVYDEMMVKDSTFSESTMNQLYFLYRNSEHYERERHMIYPVFRIE
jgi:hypothetical protein